MELKLGAQIAALRKQNGMTQEQLAGAVGVSPPAVSKWETDSSCPDIALLCPLARALGTNVDTLLRFESTLTSEQVGQAVNAVIETARAEGCEAAEAQLQELLHTYPSCIPLKYNTVAVLDMFVMMFFDKAEKREQWTVQKRRLLEEIHASGDGAYAQYAISGLAGVALEQNELEKAELLLNELPDHINDPTLLWMQLHLKRDEVVQAKEVVQKRLYVLVSQAQQCLTMLLNPQLEPQAENALELCQIIQQLQELFGVGGGLGDGFFVEVYQRLGQPEKALEHLGRMVKAINTPLPMPHALLFGEMLKTAKTNTTVTPEMKQMLLKGMLDDKQNADLRGCEGFDALVQQLEAALAATPPAGS